MNRNVALRSVESRRGAGRGSGGGAPAKLRRGVAVLLVLGMLAMTLALSYASLRGQATVAQLAENLGRGQSARMAAESGVYAALRKMSEGTWAGVNTPISGNIGDSAWYEVTFLTGDAQLAPADPKYGEFAYRVTITSTGYASDPAQPTVRAIHRIDAVVQLARRTILAEPAGWSELEPLAVHQWGNRPNFAQFPVKIEGPTNFLGSLSLFPEYPLSLDPEARYFRDLEKMRVEGQGDFRPFRNPVKLAYAQQTAETLNHLQNNLGVATSDTTASQTAPVNHPGSVVSYKLYPGGKSYSVPILQTQYGSALQNLTLEPNQATNPLGLFRSRNSLAIYNNVTIKGTIISEGTTPDIQIHGTNVRLEGVNMAPLEGSSQAYRLPTAIIRDDLRFHGTSNAQVYGLAMVYDQFEIKGGSKSMPFLLDGQLMTTDFAVRGRSDIALLGALEWETQHALFLTQLLLPGSTKYFPVWMRDKSGVPFEPLINFRRDTSGVKYHWHTWSQPVYQRDPADAGLRWNLVRWTEAS
jgi:hypothetical protein